MTQPFKELTNGRRTYDMDEAVYLASRYSLVDRAQAYYVVCVQGERGDEWDAATQNELDTCFPGHLPHAAYFRGREVWHKEVF